MGSIYTPINSATVLTMANLINDQFLSGYTGNTPKGFCSSDLYKKKMQEPQNKTSRVSGTSYQNCNFLNLIVLVSKYLKFQLWTRGISVYLETLVHTHGDVLFHTWPCQIDSPSASTSTSLPIRPLFNMHYTLSFFTFFRTVAGYLIANTTRLFWL